LQLTDYDLAEILSV